MSADVKGVKGFTIIEVLIALAIFGIGILAVAKMQISATGHNTSSRVYTEAASVGGGGVEELINLDFDDSDLEINDAENPYHERTDVGPNNMYDIKWKVKSAVPTPAGDVQVKSIEVEVKADRFPDREFNATYYKAITY